jgi:hypothetical protein
MHRTLQRATVIVGLAFVGLLPIGAAANASATVAVAATATVSSPPVESQACCYSGGYSSYDSCISSRSNFARYYRVGPCQQSSFDGTWGFTYGEK